ncbi:DNA polymerase III subunit beta [Methylomagnum ishizawai]|uniref:DNA polymerase III subunit beta n=1 Tax=Methylomagnum ishizawai TaxID=1760988 RepID=UPI001C3415F1|nr:DNA polymerase III subunit beta [Methylomagnum ishizawai]BBL72904.1 DNA polymerase III subunit beta [Methylomagnum ishizawai]
MKFTIARETLLTPLQQVIGVIEKRQTLPILSNVLLKLSDGQLELTGTDLEVQLITRTTVESGEDGAITVPARKLLDICRLLPDKSAINVDCKDERFAIRCGSSKFNLATLPADNYPEFDTGTTELEVAVPAATLRRALEKTTFAMAQQDVRYYLNGLLLDVDGRTLRTVASDGHRLAVFEEVLEIEGQGRQIIIPRKGVLELARLLGEGAETVTVQIAPNTVRVNLGAVSFAAKLIEGRFPDFQRVMPRDLARIMLIDKDVFKGALTRVSVLSNEKYKSISMEVDEEAVMSLKAQNPEHEEAEERVPIQLEGSGLSVGFNAAYLLDAINNVGSAQVRLSFTEAANSCLIEDCEDSHFKFIVMPMRL